MFKPLLIGGGLGVGVAVAAPFINQYVPAVGPVQPTPLALLGGGAALKLLHKGGAWADGMLSVGSFMVGAQLAAGMTGGGAVQNTGGVYYF